ncbi:polysaccharide biosynthesis C-terminal domain-containing protein [Pseudohoeflea coraliihabitans]|uniref:Polysaccharide biosynthesis C-terminal domain-containing protein n=1 Tax=Pseudohoeflea coraliihabitans TaxID=2860393 RepID=A0ABS6WKK4_9HYPH|nr:polysaccharide biosynthesis C-terminal domain-containing protein [Pseudohoeflea sp. DP4N28-3]MBW3096487.1 polysaccharide biosynthesis C-terminal domain-containing protein [Pseudohoeflea sp. DP4N28-3]
MTIINAAERVLPAGRFRRLRPALARLSAMSTGQGEMAKAQRMALIAFSIRIISALITFLSQIVLARIMGHFEYGIFVYVWVLAVILGNLSCLGFHTAVIRFLPQYRAAGAEDRIRGLTVTARIFAMLSATLLAGIAIATVHLLGERIPAYYVVPLIIGAFALPMIALGDVLDGTARANNWPIYALSPTYMVRPTLILLFVVGLLYYFGAVNATLALIAALVATYVTTLGQHAVILSKLCGQLARGRLDIDLRAWLAVALPIFLIEGFYFLLTNSDVIVVGIYLPPERVAVYYAAAKTMALVHFVFFAVKAAAAPRFSSLVYSGNRQELGHFASLTTRWTFWPSLTLGALALLAAPVLLSLFGPGFIEGRTVMFILFAGILAKAAVGPAETLLTMAGHQKICALLYASALAINIALNILLIPRYGIEGAALATAAAMICEALLLHLTVRRTLGMVLFAGVDQHGRLGLLPRREI